LRAAEVPGVARPSALGGRLTGALRQAVAAGSRAFSAAFRGDRLQLAASLADPGSEYAAERLRFHTAINNMSQGLCFFDGAQRLIVCNDLYAQMYRLPFELCRSGTSLAEIVDGRYLAGTVPNMSRDEYLAWRAGIGSGKAASESIAELRDGRIFLIRHQPMPDGGWVATHEDITERRAQEAAITRLAHHDTLTGLPNRAMFRDRLDTALRGADASEGGEAVSVAVALLLIDLDHFKSVNDTLGHPVGDGLLRAVAQRLGACIREGDLVARLGGDEFAILQFGAPPPSAVAALAERAVRVLAEPFEVSGQRVLTGASIGAALAPEHGNDADDLLKRADLALYDAKSNGRGRVSLYTVSMGESATERRTLEADLRCALGRDEFELAYQPIVRNASEPRVIAFEALLRWNHPTRGRVMPDTFIPVAEETGAIGAIGAWVLRAAFAEAMQWPSEVSIAVNLSPVQFSAPCELVEAVKSALLATGLAAKRVELEITESVLLAENATNLATLHELKALGIRICLDDFGVGYSSLSYLRSFPFHKLKIDRSFVCDMTTNADAAAIVCAIAALAHSLRMQVTAEGVDDERQIARLREYGCDELQGYYLSPPRPAAELAAVMAKLERRFDASDVHDMAG
jgi:diguanylate cyclase (GGDEF)-like protein